MTFMSWKARCVLGLLSALSVTSKEDLCIVRMSGGKMQRLGNCQEFDKSSVLEDLRLKAQGASTTLTSTPKMTNAVTTEDSTVIQTTKQETSIATTPEMKTLTIEKTAADIQTTQMVTTQLVRHNGSVYGACTRSRPGPHFWVSVRANKEVTFEQGRQICQDCDSVPAVIPDKATSLAIYQAIQRSGSPELWTGTTFDPKTGTLSPSYSYWEYGSKNIDASNTKVSVAPNSIGGIMKPFSPDVRINGIVCWKPKS